MLSTQGLLQHDGDVVSCQANAVLGHVFVCDPATVMPGMYGVYYRVQNRCAAMLCWLGLSG